MIILSSAHLVTVTLQVVQDVTTSLPHVFLAPIYHLLIDVDVLLRIAQPDVMRTITLRTMIWLNVEKKMRRLQEKDISTMVIIFGFCFTNSARIPPSPPPKISTSFPA